MVQLDPSKEEVPEQLYEQFRSQSESIPEYHPLCGTRIGHQDGRPMGCDYIYKSEDYFKQRCSSLTAPGKNRCPYHDHPVFLEDPTLEQFRDYRPHTVTIVMNDLRRPFRMLWQETNEQKS
jgi:hypothetical protein